MLATTMKKRRQPSASHSIVRCAILCCICCFQDHQPWLVASCFQIQHKVVSSSLPLLHVSSIVHGPPRKSSRNSSRLYSIQKQEEKEKEEFQIEQSTIISSNSTNEETETTISTSSQRQNLLFALPALGIFLSSPLLSNIDNAFVGRTVGTAGLAALSPATICTDQMLYFFSFLSRATTGIVSRAYNSPTTTNDTTTSSTTTVGNIEAARDAASTPLTISIFCGIGLSIFYALFTPQLLNLLQVNPTLLPSSASYVYWRGAIAWAALAQNVALSILLATGDAMSPLKIIGMGAGVNVIADAMLCYWPLRMGCAGAAAATSFATLMSCSFLLFQTLRGKGLLPQRRNLIRIPPWKKVKELLEYVGPLMAITITRLMGFISMQRAAMRLGVVELASYQICINALIFFLLFGEPLSQLHQTKLPSLLDGGDTKGVKETIISVLKLAGYTASIMGGVAWLALTFGSSTFSSDLAVQSLTRRTAPAVFLSVLVAIITVAIDGAMLAGKDFGFILGMGISTCIGQLFLTSRATSLWGIFGSFTARLGTYSLVTIVRTWMGRGTLGRVLMKKEKGEILEEGLRKRN